MSEIKVGDLCWIVKPMRCCGSDSTVGKIVRIIDGDTSPFTRCLICGHREETGTQRLLCDDDRSRLRYRLKRIPPLSELEGLKSEDELPIEHKVKT